MQHERGPRKPKPPKDLLSSLHGHGHHHQHHHTHQHHNHHHGQGNNHGGSGGGNAGGLTLTQIPSSNGRTPSLTLLSPLERGCGGGLSTVTSNAPFSLRTGNLNGGVVSTGIKEHLHRFLIFIMIRGRICISLQILSDDD